MSDTHRGAGIAVINHDYTNILLVKQKASAKWGLPKGHLKEREAPWRGALRELNEETGIWLKSTPYRKQRKYPLRINGKSLYIVQLINDLNTFRPDPDEISEVQWRPILEIQADAQAFPDKYNTWIRLFFRAFK